MHRAARPSGPAQTLHRRADGRTGQGALPQIATVRLIFLSALGSTFVGLILLGSAFAWTNTAYVTDIHATVGELHFRVALELPTSQLSSALGVEQVVTGSPGTENFAGFITVKNEADFWLRLLASGNQGSQVVITSATLPGGGLCPMSNFSGLVHDLYVGDFQPGTQATVGYVTILINPGAPPGCAGAIVAYDILITMTT